MNTIRIWLFTALAMLQMGAMYAQGKWYDVKTYGALGDTSQLATNILQKAIDECHRAGGGKVYLPPGQYLSGTLVLRDHVTLYLEAGATLFASRRVQDFRPGFPIYKNDQSDTPVLIYAEGAKNIGIEGEGEINGRAERVYEDLRSVDGFIAEETEIARKAGIEMKMYYKLPPATNLVYLVGCEDVSIKDVSLVESSSWTLHVQWCNRVFIRGVFIYSNLEQGVNADGIDIDGSKNVVVSDCVIETGDDAIVLKTTLTNNRSESCENVTVTNCSLTSTSTALKLGTESHSDFRHIVFNNCVIRNTNRGLSIVIRDGATASDIIFSSITLETNRKHFNWWGNGDPIWLVVKKRSPESAVGTIKNVLFENIVAHGQGTSKLEGFGEGHLLENIQLRNVQFFMYPEGKPDKRATDAFHAHDVKGLFLENIKVSWSDQEEVKWGSALSFKNVGQLRLFGFEGRQGKTTTVHAPIILMENIEDGLVDRLIFSEPFTTGLQVGGAKTDQLKIGKIYGKEEKRFKVGKFVERDAVIFVN